MSKLMFKGPRSKSLTQQQFKNSVNINTIMAKAKKTGVLPVRTNQPYFGDFSIVTNYKEMLDKVLAIDELFMQLPSKVRNKFANNPEEILTFLQDPKNEDEAREIGLLRPLTREERIERREAEQAAQAAPTTAEPAPAQTEPTAQS